MNNITYYVFLILLFHQYYAQSYSLELSNSIVLNSNANVSFVNMDFSYNFIVAFTDSTARKYSPDFSYYINLPKFPQVVTYLVGRRYAATTTLSNGTVLSMNNRIYVGRSNNYTTVRDYNYNTYANYEVYNLNETFLSQGGYPLVVSGVFHTFHLFFCTNSIQIGFKGTIVKYIPLSTIMGANVTCNYALVYSYPTSVSVDNFYVNASYFFALNNKKVYLLFLDLVFTFNYTIDHYDFVSATYSRYLVYTALTNINYLAAASGILYMQSNTTGASYVYNVGAGTMGTTVNIPLGQSLKFFYYNSSLYLLQANSLYFVNYNSGTNTLSYGSNVQTLPTSSYSLCFGQEMDVLFTYNSSSIYKGGSCNGASLYLNGSCVSYGCSVTNCQTCFGSRLICGVCKSGYILQTKNYTCMYNLNVQGSYYALFNSTLTTAISLFADSISIPAIRKYISPAFIYFGIFDDLYLYQFHDRVYGTTINNLFVNINGIENKKWSFVNSHTIFGYLRIDEQDFNSFTDYQSNYTYYQFSDVNHMNVGPEGLWGNCQNWILLTVPITIVGFLLLQQIFKLFHNYSISLLFRRYAFWLYCLIIILDGNTQQLVFYLCCQMKNLFAFSLGNKLIKISTILFGFIIVFFSVSLYFLSSGLYNRLNRYFMENNKNNFIGQFLLIMQIGLKNLYLGILHSILRVWSYQSMILILIGSQIVFNFIFALSAAGKLYEFTFRIWIYLLLNFIKITIMATLYVDYNNIESQTIQSTQQFLIFLEVLVFVLGSLHQTVIAVKQTFGLASRIFCSSNPMKVQSPQQKLLKDKLSRNGFIVYVTNIKPEDEIQKSITFNSLQKKLKPYRPSNYLKPPKTNSISEFNSSRISVLRNQNNGGGNKRYFKLNYNIFEQQ